MSFWEKLLRRLRLLAGIFFLACAFYSIYNVSSIQTCNFSLAAACAVGSVLVAAVCGLIAAFFLAGPITDDAGKRVGGLLYPLRYFTKSHARLAAAESLAAKKDFAGARAALEAILEAEPDNFAAALSLSKTLLTAGFPDARIDACKTLLVQLERRSKAKSGESDAVLLLCDLLEEGGLRDKALDVLRSELSKGYCRAEDELLKKRLAVLEGIPH